MIYETIKELRPYFYSLREVEKNARVSLDIKFPALWEYDNIVSKYEDVTSQVQQSNEKHTLLSIVSAASELGYEMVFKCALELITFNNEREEKQKLFNEKVTELQNLFTQKTSELQQLFLNEPLDKLKEINVTENYGGQEDTKRTGGTPKRNRKEPNGD